MIVFSNYTSYKEIVVIGAKREEGEQRMLDRITATRMIIAHLPLDSGLVLPIIRHSCAGDQRRDIIHLPLVDDHVILLLPRASRAGDQEHLHVRVIQNLKNLNNLHHL